MTDRQTHTTGPQSDETPTSARPHRPTSTEPVDDRTRARYLERIALAQSHAHEADRLAKDSRDAGLIHALLAHFWLNHAKEQRP